MTVLYSHKSVYDYPLPISLVWLFRIWQSFITPQVYVRLPFTNYKYWLIVLYSYDSPFLLHESVYDYPLLIISIG